MDNKEIGKFIKEKREAKGITQQQMADYLEVGLRNYQHWEAGRFPKYKTAALPKLEEKLEIKLPKINTTGSHDKNVVTGNGKIKGKEKSDLPAFKDMDKDLPSGGVKITLRHYLSEVRENKAFLQDVIKGYLAGMKSNLDYAAAKSEALEYDLKSEREVVLQALSEMLGHQDLNQLLKKADKRKRDLALAKAEAYKKMQEDRKSKRPVR